MNIRVVREHLKERVTLGRMYLDGDFHCFTLEDVVRPEGVKVPGQTAIPYGRYEVIVNFSKRFQRPMPLLVDVPGFFGVRIHAGNSDADTDGCILVGKRSLEDRLLESREAFSLFMLVLNRAMLQAKVFISIERAGPPPIT